MAQEKNRLYKGIVTDTEYVNQPKGTYTFALNAIENKDSSGRYNENSNKRCLQLNPGEQVIGSVNIDEESTVLFSVIPTTGESLISLFKDCKRNVLVNHSELNFSIEYPIQAVFRIRRGCGKIIYWVDGKNPPRIFNIDKPYDFKTGGNWDIEKFELIKKYNIIPKFEKVEIKHNGKLKSGSYSIGIQYVDSSLNPTEWIIVSNPINIYKSNDSDDFLDLHGTANGKVRNFESRALNHGETDKSIAVTLSFLDDSYQYYRLAFIEATDGVGEITSVKITNNIPISQKTFEYTGNNFKKEITEEEIQIFNTKIESADSIAINDNGLVLSNISYGNKNLCELQKYASKIAVDAVVKEVSSSTLVDNNIKSGTLHINSLSNGHSFMPDEMYSLGIRYRFEDNTVSPVFHIPGKSIDADEYEVFSPGANVYPMSKNNTLQDVYYTDRQNCNINYWGKDNKGVDLKNLNVRHHRFPSRHTINKPLVRKTNTYLGTDTIKAIRINYFGDTLINGRYSGYDANGNQVNNGNPMLTEITLKVAFINSQNNIRFNLKIDPNKFAWDANDYSNTQNVSIPETWTQPAFPDPPYSDAVKGKVMLYLPINFNYDTVQITEEYNGTTHVFPNSISLGGNTDASPNTGLKYKYEMSEVLENRSDFDYKVNTFGLKFSNIELPPATVTNNKKVIGYEIMVQERKDEDSSVLDSAVLFPVRNKYDGANSPNNFKASSLLGPLSNKQFSDDYYFTVVNPEYKFRDKHTNNEYFSIEGFFYRDNNPVVSRPLVQDVLDGSSYNPDAHSENEKDDDGWDLKVGTREHILEYVPIIPGASYPDMSIVENNYFKPLQKKIVSKDNFTLYNASADNSVNIIKTKESSYTFKNNINLFPYIYLRRNLLNPYSNFLTEPYYTLDSNIQTSDTFTTFNGDIYISPMRYANTLFYQNKVRERENDDPSWWEYGLAVIGIVAGIVLAPITAGASLVLTGAGLLLLANEIKKEKLISAYSIDYERGLRDTIYDVDIRDNFKDYNPPDDEIQWIGEVFTDLWFESKINIGLRVKLLEEQSFLSAPGKVVTSSVYNNPPHKEIDLYFINKLTTLDPKRKGGFAYRGHPLGEGYFINEDYHLINKNKPGFHLPVEYDCCSNCPERFKQRFIWSQQAYQEELSDNFRVFLPNNFKDLEGEINNTFSWYNTLYLHTDKGLFSFPRRYQERVADDLITLIGTGEQYALSPRKVTDSDFNRGGILSKWSNVITNDSVYFISEIDKKVYKFNGKSLIPISDIGNSNLFRDILTIKTNIDFHRNNPISQAGTGFHGTYDMKNKRVIFTKKDYVYTSELPADSKLVYCNGMVKIFYAYQATINNYTQQGYRYLGIVGCQMVFTRDNEIEKINASNIFLPTRLNNSATFSFNEKGELISFHSYLPNIYISNSKLYSQTANNSFIYEHNKEGNYQQFFDKKYPFIIEYVNTNKDFRTRVFNNIRIYTEAMEYTDKGFVEDRLTTFNKLIAYTDKQCTNELDLVVKDNFTTDYFSIQNNHPANQIMLDKKEKEFRLNELRNAVTYNGEPIFLRDLESLQNDYYIDKVINPTAFENVNWYNREKMRDKYLVVRFIFTNLHNNKRLFVHNFSGHKNLTDEY